ncbi:ATP-binding protein [Romboutsia sp.]|uniref:sensor histidine kinase n=1 Tax=Romboutsia sp. TaxID=1965302 RepID=UPI003F39A454
MKAILDSIENYIMIVSRKGNIKFCNKKLLSKIEYQDIDLYNKNINKLINSEDGELTKILRKIILGEKINLDIDVISKYKDYVSLNCDVLINDFENEESIFIIGKDVFEKYYNREILENALDILPFSMWIKDLDGRFKYVNKHKAELLKLDRKDFLNKYDRDFTNEKNYNFFHEIDKEVIRTKMPKIFEEIMEKDNSQYWYETFKAPMFDENNNVKLTVAASNNINIVKKLIEEPGINCQVINQVKNIVSKGKHPVHTRNVVEEIGREVFKSIGTDNIDIYTYNQRTSYLEKEVTFGKKINIEECHQELLYLSKEQVEKIKENKKYEGFNNIENIENELLKDIMIKNKINCIGYYYIIFNDEFIGLLSVKYLNENKVKIIMDDFIKAMCSYLGLHIKNRELSQEILYEIEKRTETEKELEDLLEISVDLIIKIRTNGRIVKVNRKWTDTFGWSEEELLKKNILEIIHNDYQSDALDIMGESENVFDNCINKILCKDGSYKIISWNYKTLPMEGFVMATGKDITRQRQEEERRRKLEEAIKLESFKNEFFANVSHEFKTPLNIILGSIQLITRKIELEKLPIELEQKYKNYIKPIKQNSYRLLRLVNNLIDITRIDSGFYQMQLGNYDIVSIVEDITLSVAQYVENKGINLIFDTNCEEKVIACDPDKIERIMLNLLSNAIKYTSEKGQIFVNISVNYNTVCVSVQDDGIGIPKNELDAIFERFKQVDNILTRKCEGSGIGLSLVKSLVELHKGKIYVNSQVGEGTKFTFELPIGIVDCYQKNLMLDNIYKDEQIEKCSIEFSDIYV